MFIVRLEGVVGMVQALDEAEGCFLLLSCFSDDLMRRSTELSQGSGKLVGGLLLLFLRPILSFSLNFFRSYGRRMAPFHVL